MKSNQLFFLCNIALFIVIELSLQIIIIVLYPCAFVIFHQNNFPSLLQLHLFSDHGFTHVTSEPRPSYIEQYIDANVALSSPLLCQNCVAFKKKQMSHFVNDDNYFW